MKKSNMIKVIALLNAILGITACNMPKNDNKEFEPQKVPATTDMPATTTNAQQFTCTIVSIGEA